jgi:hypothetical protein
MEGLGCLGHLGPLWLEAFLGGAVAGLGGAVHEPGKIAAGVLASEDKATVELRDVGRRYRSAWQLAPGLMEANCREPMSTNSFS